MKRMKEVIEGPEAFRRFDKSVGKILSVSRATLMGRELEYRKESAANPNRRGPKPKGKVKASASGHASSDRA